MDGHSDDTEMRHALRDLQGDAGMWGITPQPDPIADSAAAVAQTAGLVMTPPTSPQGAATPVFVDEPWPAAVTQALADDEGDWDLPGVGNTPEGPDVLDDPRAPKMLPRMEVYVSSDDYEANYLEQKLADVTDGGTYLGVTWDVVTASGVETIRPLITKADITALDDHLVIVSANDTTPGNIEAKLVGETASDRVPVSFKTNDDGGNETRGLYIDYTDLPVTEDKLVEVSGNDTTPGDLETKLVGETDSDRAPVSFVTNSDGGNETLGLYVDHTDIPVIPHDILDGDAHTDAATGTAARGDVIVGNAAGKLARVAIAGSAGKVLTSDGTDAAWTAWRLPAGFIGLWSGSIATIPAGWALCDGNNGTPDLRDRFIVGAASDAAAAPHVDATGGYKWHGETENNHGDHLVAHTHLQGSSTNLDADSGIVEVWNAGVASSEPTWTGTDAGVDEKPAGAGAAAALSHNGPYNTNADTDNRPPSYALAYIMKT